MKRLTTLVLLSLPTIAFATPGLIGEYFQLKEKLGDEFEVPVNQQPWLVRADKQINFPEVSGNFYGSKLGGNFMVRWSGTITITNGDRNRKPEATAPSRADPPQSPRDHCRGQA